MRIGTALFILLSLVLFGCNSIHEYDEDDRVTTRKIGPTDLKELGEQLNEDLRASDKPWMEGRPTLAIAEFRNITDKPGLNKQPFIDVIQDALYEMDRFDLIEYQRTKELIEEKGIQDSDHYDKKSAARMGKAIGAKYIMWGDISSMVDTGGRGRQIKQYSLTIRIVSVELHRIVYYKTVKTKIKAVD